MTDSSKARVAATIVISGVLALAMALPAAAEGPEFITERNYFQCSGTTKVANVNDYQDEPYPTWSTQAPTQSVQAGAGCGWAEPGGVSGNAADAVWAGTWTGNIHDILMELHFIAPQTPAYGDIAIDVLVTIDGQTYEGLIDAAPTTASDTGASYSMLFGINDIDIIDDEEGPGDVEHSYKITARGHFIDSGAAIAFVWGTTEVPSGLTFNGKTKGLPSVEVH